MNGRSQSNGSGQVLSRGVYSPRPFVSSVMDLLVNMVSLSVYSIICGE